MAKRIILLFVVCLNGSLLSAQHVYSKSILIEDVREFVDILENTHPEPYLKFGGKIQFHKQIQTLIDSIPEGGLTAPAFYDRLSNFVAKMHDGHTFLVQEPQEDHSTDSILPVSFKITTDGLVISRSEKEMLNGACLVAVNTIPVETLLQNVQPIKPVENKYGAYFELAQALMSYRSTQKLLGSIDPKGLEIKLLLPEGRSVVKTISYVSFDDRKSLLPSPPDAGKDARNDAPFAYRYVDAPKKVACLRYTSTFSREVIELQKQWGQDYTHTLSMLYEKCHLGSVPDSYEEAIRKLPSFAETFFDLLHDMKKNESTHLIIDLRENGGGWMPINISSLYMLKGDAYFAYDCKAEYHTLISERFLEKMNMTLEEYNESHRSTYKIGDYQFGYFMRNSWPDDMPLDGRRKKYLRDTFNKDFSEWKLLESIDGRVVYSPKIIVITSPATFSSAFQYAFLLKEICDAVIVGVPSMQAYNNGIGSTYYRLQHTGIRGSVSNSFQLFDPEYLIPESIFRPDYPLTKEIFLKYHCDKDAEIAYILDLIRDEKISLFPRASLQTTLEGRGTIPRRR